MARLRIREGTPSTYASAFRRRPGGGRSVSDDGLSGRLSGGRGQVPDQGGGEIGERVDRIERRGLCGLLGFRRRRGGMLCLHPDRSVDQPDRFLDKRGRILQGEGWLPERTGRITTAR